MGFETVLLEGNKPVLLSKVGKIWIVDKGSVDIFSVPTENGEPGGPRIHLFRAEEGSGIIEIGVHRSGIGLLAVGIQGTQVRVFDMDTLDRELSGDEVKRVIETWVRGLLDGVSRGDVKPRRITNIEKPGDKLSLSKDGMFGILPEFGWIKVNKGRLLLIDKRNFPRIGEGAVFPATERVWFRVEEDAEVELIPTEEVLKGDWTGIISEFHSYILEAIAVRFQEYIEESRKRLEKRTESDKAVRAGALSKISSILTRLKRREYVPLDKDPLVAACTLIARKLGMELKEPSFQLPKDPVVALQELGRHSGFRVRKVILREGWWRKDAGPLLGLIKETREPVALIPKGFTKYTYFIPGRGESGEVDYKFSESLEPFAYTFYRPFPNKPIDGKELIKFGFKDCFRDLVVLLVMALFGALLGLLIPIMTGIIFNSIIPEAAYNQLFQITFILFASAVATVMFDITKGIALLRLQGRMNASIQAAIWDRLLSLPVPFFRKYTAGDLAQRSMGINYIRQMLSGATVNVIISAVFSVFNVFLLLYYDWKLALIAMLMSTIGIGITGLLSYLQVKYQKKISEIEGKLSGMVFQFLTGIGKLKITGTEDRAFSVWADKFTEKRRLSFKAGLIASLMASFTASFPVLVSMGIFAWVVFKSSGLSTGDFIAFNSAFANLQNALIQMTTVVTSLIAIVPLYERMKPIIVTPPETDEKKADPGELEGDIEVSHVYFRYDPDGPLILKDVSLHVYPGEFVAIVGGSGSGKSTLFRLLLGFETPESGTIYYDGQDLASLDIKAVRRQIGVVLQNGQLMPDSIFKNIVGSSNLTIDDAWEAARMVGLDKDIKEMPMGMHTVVSPGGTNLSGGQRQRLLIARAIVKKPRIILFDEATSALDNETQRIVSESLEKLQATRIVIAHRLSTIINADRIYVLHLGVIREVGTYDELMRKGGFFARLAKRQLA